MQLLKEVAPEIAHATMMFNPHKAAQGGAYFYPPLEAAARSLRITPAKAPFNNPEEIDAAVASVTAQPQSGLVVAPDVFTSVHRRLIIAVAARHRVPAIYASRYNAVDGGLMAYGIDTLDSFRLLGNYIGRILNGSLPADLPVQTPTKIEFVINLRTATALLHTCLFLVFGQMDRTSALAMTPYAVWVLYAAYLNAGVWWLNGSDPSLLSLT